MSEFGDEKICGGWPGDAWSSNLLGFASLVSNKIDIGPVRHDSQLNHISMAFNALGRILLVSSAWVELSVWMGVRGCGCSISSSVCRMDMAVLALMNSAPNSASAADDITAIIICEIYNTPPLLMGISSKPAMNMWPPALLRAFGSER
jgi:hypothetical protein